MLMYDTFISRACGQRFQEIFCALVSHGTGGGGGGGAPIGIPPPIGGPPMGGPAWNAEGGPPWKPPGGRKLSAPRKLLARAKSPLGALNAPPRAPPSELVGIRLPMRLAAPEFGGLTPGAAPPMGCVKLPRAARVAPLVFATCDARLANCELARRLLDWPTRLARLLFP